PASAADTNPPESQAFRGVRVVRRRGGPRRDVDLRSRLVLPAVPATPAEQPAGGPGIWCGALRRGRVGGLGGGAIRPRLAAPFEETGRPGEPVVDPVVHLLAEGVVEVLRETFTDLLVTGAALSGVDGVLVPL